jgi:Ca2+-binding RTX toxin-like protein
MTTRHSTGKGIQRASRLNRKNAAVVRARRELPTLPAVELVESRCLLSASASGGVLTVTGTEFADNILVTANSSGQISVTINNQLQAGSPFSGITSIVVNALGSDDQITIRPDGQDTFGTVAGATINCGDGNDTANGGSGNDVIRGGIGNDELSGKGGDDVLDGGPGADKMFGGNGVDTADYSARTENLTITLDGSANDGATGEGDNVKDTVENVSGGSGNDNISSPDANNINNTFAGGDGNDNLSGGGGDDVLDGWVGHDTCTGGEGNDVLYGWTGYDVLRGNGGADQLYGEQDGDTCNGGLGPDLLDGGDGDDVADYSDRTENLSITLDGVANDGIPAGLPYRDPVTGRWVLNRGEQDNVLCEHVWGGSGNDYIAAPTSDTTTNIFIGNGGNDYLDGGGGSDYLFGGEGDDVLIGNDGVWDNLTGGNGTDLVKADSFDYQNGNEGTYTGLPPVFF